MSTATAEQPRQHTAADVLRRLEDGDDVLRVHKFLPIAEDRYRYLIETPFQTYPKFVIGTIDSACADIQIEVQMGAEWNALEHWEAASICSGPYIPDLDRD